MHRIMGDELWRNNLFRLWNKLFRHGKNYYQGNPSNEVKVTDIPFQE
jgi:hypothetical protein